MNGAGQNNLEERATLQLKKILVPTDFSAESMKAVDYGVAFARQFGAEMTLVHVIEPPPPHAGFEAVPIAVDESALLVNAEQRLKELGQKQAFAGVKTRMVVRHGSAYREIIEVAQRENIDMIIVSTHGRTGLDRALFGSTAEHIVQRAGCPVLVVRQVERQFVSPSARGEALRVERMLVPIDLSNASRKALRYAQALAATFNARITCVHALEVPYGTGEAAYALQTETFQKEWEEQARGQIESLLLEERIKLPPEQCLIKRGTAYREILDLAQEGIDLIVMSTHGRSGIRHFLLGSTTERVVRYSTCPVLVVREREHEFVAKGS